VHNVGALEVLYFIACKEHSRGPFPMSRSCHAEFDGTAIETSITATLRLTLHKKGALPLKLSKLNFPLLENANEYVVHGFTYGVRLRIPSFQNLSESHSKWKKRSGVPCPNRAPNCRSSQAPVPAAGEYPEVLHSMASSVWDEPAHMKIDHL
jgi:hypothetical protein